MNIYHAFYKGKKVEVKAETPYAAQLKAAAEFKAKKSYEVAVVVVAVGERLVVHDGSEL